MRVNEEEPDRAIRPADGADGGEPATTPAAPTGGPAEAPADAGAPARDAAPLPAEAAPVAGRQVRRLVVASTPGPAPAPAAVGSPWRLPAPRHAATGTQPVVDAGPAAPGSPFGSSDGPSGGHPAAPAGWPDTGPAAAWPDAAPGALLAPERAPELPRPPDAAPPPPAEWGWRGALRRLTGGAVALPPGAEELRYRAARAAVRRSFTRPMTVVFANPKGGSGKTPATLLAAATLGLLRGGYVVAWDNNETRGTLGLRAQPDLRPSTVWDLLANMQRFETLHARVGDLAVFLRHQEEQFDVLASDESPGNMAQIGHREYERIRALLCRFYKILCVDTGDNVRASTWQSAMRSADLLVVCSTAQEDVGRSGLWMLDHLDQVGRHDLVANAVTVLSDAHPRPDPSVRRDLAERYAARTRDVVHVPYDPALASGGRIVHAELGRGTRRAWLHACASITEGLAAVEARPPVAPRVRAPEARTRGA